jgi:hypothetical protein
MVLTRASVLPLFAGSPGLSNIWVYELLLAGTMSCKGARCTPLARGELVGSLCLRLSPRACLECSGVVCVGQEGA